MKRLVCLLILAVFIMGWMSGCKKEELFEPKLYGITGEIPGVTECEYQLSAITSFTDELQPETATIEFLGETVTGNYSGSKIVRGVFTPEHYFIGNYHGEKIKFGLDSEQKLMSVALFANHFDMNPANTEEEYLQVARDFVSRVLCIELEKYVAHYGDYLSSSQLVTVTFQKYVCGIPTYEQVTVFFNEGCIFSFRATKIGQFSENNLEIDSGKLDRSVEKRCDELTKELRNSFAYVNYDRIEHELTIDADGRYVIFTGVWIHWGQSSEECSGEATLAFIQYL